MLGKSLFLRNCLQALRATEGLIWYKSSFHLFNWRDVEIYHLQKGKNVEGGVIQVKHTTIDIKVVRLPSSDTRFTSLIGLTHVSDPRRGSTSCIDCSKQAHLATELDPTSGFPLCIQPTYWVWYWSRVAREPSVSCEWESRARQGSQTHHPQLLTLSPLCLNYVKIESGIQLGYRQWPCMYGCSTCSFSPDLNLTSHFLILLFPLLP